MNIPIHSPIRLLALAGVGALLAASLPASAAADLAKARAECGQQKERVQQMERRSTDLDNDPALIQARQDWEMACYRASQLMVQAGQAEPARAPQPSSTPFRTEIQLPPPAAVTPVTPATAVMPDTSSAIDPDSTPVDPDGDGVPTYTQAWR